VFWQKVKKSLKTLQRLKIQPSWSNSSTLFKFP
jgi:hypothetical protein